METVELFAGLSEVERDLLEKTAVFRNYPKNTVVITEGDAANALYIIQSGRVKVYCSDKTGKEFVVNTQGPGDYFGELSLLDDENRSASVRTMEKSEFMIIYKDDFTGLLDAHPTMYRVLIRNLVRRIRTLTENAKSLALKDVYGRVATMITSMADPGGETGTGFIEDRLTQQDIADRVGASREMVARILKDLTIGEYIEISGKHIEIKKKLPLSY